LLHLLAIELLGRDILAAVVVIVETPQRFDLCLAFGGVIGAVEFKLDIGNAFDEEGLTAFIGAPINFLTNI
jgi:hypothetical protein